MTAIYAQPAQIFSLYRRSFFDLPIEVRQIIYAHYFSTNIQTPYLVLNKKIQAVLPCSEQGYFSLIHRRMLRYGLTLSQSAQNPAIALLHMCRTLYQEALGSLYRHKAFTWSSSLSSLPKSPQVFRNHIRGLIILNPRILCENTVRGWAKNNLLLRIASPSYEDDREKSSDDGWDSVPRNPSLRSEVANVTSLWRSVLCDAMKLEYLTIDNLDAFEILGLYRDWAMNAVFHSRATRIHLTTYNHSSRHSDGVEQSATKGLIEKLPVYKAQVAAKNDRCIIPGVRILTVRCPQEDLNKEVLLNLRYNGCSLVCRGESETEEDGQKSKKIKYEMIFTKKKVVA